MGHMGILLYNVSEAILNLLKGDYSVWGLEVKGFRVSGGLTAKWSSRQGSKA